MKIIPLDKVIVRDRQRTEIEKSGISDLAASIFKNGLLHPPVVWEDEEGCHLVAGERRTRAIQQLAAEKRSFRCGEHTIEPGFIIVGLYHEGDVLARKEAELDENVVRIDLDWRDRAKALAEIHRLQQERNPSQTMIATANMLAEKGGIAGGVSSPRSIFNTVRKAVVLDRHLDNPVIAKARNEKEALALIMKGEEEKFSAELINRKLKRASSSSDITVRQGSLLEILPVLEDGIADLILADPPYGIEAGAAGFRGRTVHHHTYDDKEGTAREILECILIDGFRIAKQRANLFLFTDIKHWPYLQDQAARAGWVPFRTPIIWQKSESEGLAPWGRSGFRRTYEVIFFATKGRRGLLSSPTDILRVNRVPRNERLYGPEKPVELLKLLIETSTMPGDFILDPCCGSGSTLVACRELRRRGLGIEIDPRVVNIAKANALGHLIEDSTWKEVFGDAGANVNGSLEGDPDGGTSLPTADIPLDGRDPLLPLVPES